MLMNASGAGFNCLPLDHFKIHGPNGDHFCFVYPVLGPNVSLGFFHASGDADKDLRALGLQVTKAIAFLHRKRICHGDLTPNNVLHRSGQALCIHLLPSTLGRWRLRLPLGFNTYRTMVPERIATEISQRQSRKSWLIC
ncbi:hypothetical protein LZ554_009031 [Drepanopeziza brunnea f. sp. 'monogermtubi']|nr:hypothetical protein LZ554_009031 [Drepanopeziza brunnea f. sp. 'monogermtubi']